MQNTLVSLPWWRPVTLAGAERFRVGVVRAKGSYDVEVRAAGGGLIRRCVHRGPMALHSAMETATDELDLATLEFEIALGLV